MSKRWVGIITYGLAFLSTKAMALPNANSNALNHTELLRVIGGLLLVLLIIIVLSWLVKRLQTVHIGSSNGFQSIANMTLGPKEKIILVRAGEHYLLLGVGSGSVNLIHDFGTQLPHGFDIDNKTTFAQLLKSAVRKP